MIKILHRINTLVELAQIPKEFGVEIDVRHNNPDKLYLNHEPGTGDSLEKYLKACGNRFVIFNIKEAGIENACINLAKKYDIKNYFLLDVEFPYFYKATRKEGVKAIAVRYSEVEPIEFAKAQKNFCDWVWVDTHTKLPLNAMTVKKLKGFKTCLVSPDRWGRPEDIKNYQDRMRVLNFQLDAVMVGKEYFNLW